jgi:hypothetical protein
MRQFKDGINPCEQWGILFPLFVQEHQRKKGGFAQLSEAAFA